MDDNSLEEILKQIALFKDSITTNEPAYKTHPPSDLGHWPRPCTCRRCPRCGGYLPDYYDPPYPYPTYPVWTKSTSDTNSYI